MSESAAAQQKKRAAAIVRVSAVGVLANLLLAVFKAVVGALTKSIAVTLDALNNFTDVLSSVITILGAKLSGKKPDKNHPLGHGRIEYISAMIIAALVLYAGVTALAESVKKILKPEPADYQTVFLVILAAGVAVKLALGLYVGHAGRRLHSGALTASGKDAFFDAVLSASVLLSAILYVAFGVQLEAYVGVVIAALILKSGVGMMLDTFGDLLGKRVDRELLASIRETICEDPDVRGAYDLILHDYGEGRFVGSAHVEVLDTMNADEIDHMSRRIAEAVYRRHGVLMTGIGIYAANTRDDAVAALRSDVTRRIMAHEGVLQLHGFHADVQQKHMVMDVILDFELRDRQALYEQILAEIRQAYPDYDVQIVLDLDI